MNWLTQLLDHVRREHTRCKCSPKYVGKFLSRVIIKCEEIDENETPIIKCIFSIKQSLMIRIGYTDRQTDMHNKQYQCFCTLTKTIERWIYIMAIPTH
jgi:hypothetical protein